MRLEDGARDNFENTRGATSYLYDSSVAPELRWDESTLAAEADQLLQEVRNATSLDEAKAAAAQLQGMRNPFLNWAGKAESNEIQVPCLPLFIHERLSTEAILDTLERHKRDRTGTLDLFGEGDKSIGEKIGGAYKHMNGWQNRLIHGDSLQVMNSLLEYEDMGGEVQMVYMDPPYGIKYGSNFQPYVRKRDVTDGDDKSITREPDMVEAYRDTWELGIHSWLTYMRDRLLLAHKLLNDRGSCFVQINDEHVHYVRNIMDEVFGKKNFVSVITYKKGGNVTSNLMPNIADYIVMYAKNKDVVKYRQLFERKVVGVGESTGERYDQLESPDGKTRRPQTREEKQNPKLIPDGWKPYKVSNPASMGDNPGHRERPLVFEGREYYPPAGRHWSTTMEGMERLIKLNRLVSTGNNLAYVQYMEDFPLMPVHNIWEKSRLGTALNYVVETSPAAIERCMLMSTEPGDLVFDPTCGSGTTAYVAEKWGRRWITTDVSRVPLSLARQRLLTATYPYYTLQGKSPSDGFVYKRKLDKKGQEVGGIVPHKTLGTIAHDEPPKEEVLVDKPEQERNQARITGPFCVEAVMPLPLLPAANDGEDADESAEPQAAYLSRMVNTLRLSPNICMSGNKTTEIKNVRPLAKSLSLHATATLSNDEEVAIIIGPAYAAVSEGNIIQAAKEAKGKGYADLFVVAFKIDAKTRDTVENLDKLMGIRGTYVQTATDILMGDMLKNLRTSEVFAICGQPDVALQKIVGGGVKTSILQGFVA